MPTEIYVIVTPAGILAGFLAAVVLLAAVFLAGVWAGSPYRAEAAADAVECAETVDLPRPRTGGPRTGTLHGPRYQPGLADEATTVIERVQL